jgi:hypothetical protein
MSANPSSFEANCGGAPGSPSPASTHEAVTLTSAGPSPASQRLKWLTSVVPLTVLEGGLFGAVSGLCFTVALACALSASGRGRVDARCLRASATAGAAAIVGVGSFLEGVRIMVAGSSLVAPPSE